MEPEPESKETEVGPHAHIEVQPAEPPWPALTWPDRCQRTPYAGAFAHGARVLGHATSAKDSSAKKRRCCAVGIDVSFSDEPTKYGPSGPPHVGGRLHYEKLPRFLTSEAVVPMSATISEDSKWLEDPKDHLRAIKRELDCLNQLEIVKRARTLMMGTRTLLNTGNPGAIGDFVTNALMNDDLRMARMGWLSLLTKQRADTTVRVEHHASSYIAWGDLFAWPGCFDRIVTMGIGGRFITDSGAMNYYVHRRINGLVEKRASQWWDPVDESASPTSRTETGEYRNDCHSLLVEALEAPALPMASAASPQDPRWWSPTALRDGLLRALNMITAAPRANKTPAAWLFGQLHQEEGDPYRSCKEGIFQPPHAFFRLLDAARAHMPRHAPEWFDDCILADLIYRGTSINVIGHLLLKKPVTLKEHGQRWQTEDLIRAFHALVYNAVWREHWEREQTVRAALEVARHLLEEPILTWPGRRQRRRWTAKGPRHVPLLLGAALVPCHRYASEEEVPAVLRPISELLDGILGHIDWPPESLIAAFEEANEVHAWREADLILKKMANRVARMGPTALPEWFLDATDDDRCILSISLNNSGMFDTLMLHINCWGRGALLEALCMAITLDDTKRVQQLLRRLANGPLPERTPPFLKLDFDKEENHPEENASEGEEDADEKDESSLWNAADQAMALRLRVHGGHKDPQSWLLVLAAGFSPASLELLLNHAATDWLTDRKQQDDATSPSGRRDQVILAMLWLLDSKRQTEAVDTKHAIETLMLPPYSLSRSDLDHGIANWPHAPSPRQYREHLAPRFDAINQELWSPEGRGFASAGASYASALDQQEAAACD